MAETSKRDAILEAASGAFARMGFKKTSISDIARAAGVAKGTVYLVCESKEDLFYQVVLRDLGSFQGCMAAAIDPRVPADQTLGAMSMESFEFFETHTLVRDLFTGLFHDAHPEWAARFEELRTMGRSHIADLLRLGIRQGRFRADLDIELTAAILQDFQHAALILQSRSVDVTADFERRARAGFELITRGMLAPGQELA